ncbi:hypothetical protein GCM10027199_04120 [Amycolatopsis magusensis]
MCTVGAATVHNRPCTTAMDAPPPEAGLLNLQRPWRMNADDVLGGWPGLPHTNRADFDLGGFHRRFPGMA